MINMEGTLIKIIEIVMWRGKMPVLILEVKKVSDHTSPWKPITLLFKDMQLLGENPLAINSGR